MSGALTSTSPQEATGALLAAALAEISKHPRGGPVWLVPVRARATAWLKTRGFPAPNTEAWRFTPTRSVQRIPFRPMKGTAITTGSSPALWDGPSLVSSDGAPGPLHGSAAPEVQGLSDALRAPSDELREALSDTACADGFEALNDALFDEGMLVVARAGKQCRLHVDHGARHTTDPRLSVPRLVIIAEPGSELLLIETRGPSSGALLESAVTDVRVGANAKVEHVRIAEGGPEGGSLCSVRVRQASDSRYVSRVFTFGGALARESLSITLTGTGASCVLDGLYTAGTGALVDHHTRIVHTVPHGSSTERYKGVLSEGGTGVFDGIIVVAKDAARTEAHQENRNLLLSDDAVIHAKPHLEIDTDDVKCSHGTTVGRLDPAQLFYLRSRGLSEEVARAALVVAFAREVLDSVTVPEVRSYLESLLTRALPGGSAARELA